MDINAQSPPPSNHEEHENHEKNLCESVLICG